MVSLAVLFQKHRRMCTQLRYRKQSALSYKIKQAAFKYERRKMILKMGRQPHKWYRKTKSYQWCLDVVWTVEQMTRKSWQQIAETRKSCINLSSGQQTPIGRRDILLIFVKFSIDPNILSQLSEDGIWQRLFVKLRLGRATWLVKFNTKTWLTTKQGITLEQFSTAQKFFDEKKVLSSIKTL